MKNKIYIKDWLELKPYKEQTETDSYYLKICNIVKKAITTNKQSHILMEYLDNSEINILSCFLTSYFEDIISETNIWNSFVKIHWRLYKKQLPFYSLDEYYEDEINFQDICFLIWYFLNTIQEEKFISPFNKFILEIAAEIIFIFEDEWDYAPENEFLKLFYWIDENEEDFYIARNLIDTILFKTYLFYPDAFLKLKEFQLKIIEKNKDDENVIMFLNDNRDNTLHTIHTRLLSLKGKEWASEILGKNHPLSKEFLNMPPKILGLFLYKGQDDYNIFIEHIASGKKFELTKKSFERSDILTEDYPILYIGIAKWKNEWWFSGVYFHQSFDPDIILNEKNSIQSRMAVDFLDYKSINPDKTLEMQLKAFKNFNNGSQIAFIASDKIENFFQKYIEYFNNSLNLSSKEIKAAKQRAKKEGFFNTGKKSLNFPEISKSGLVFFNPKSGIETAFSVNSAFPLSNNPFFNIDESENAVMFLLLSEEMSAELAYYCINNCKSDLPFFNDGIGKAYLEDIDFLLRFWKRKNYFSKPSITFTGTETN